MEASPPPKEQPLWLGDDRFQKSLYKFIGHPLEHPEYYDSFLVRMHDMVGIFGQNGTRKAKAVAAYCRGKLSTEPRIIRVTPRDPQQAARFLTKTFDAMMSLPAATMDPFMKRGIIIVDRADLLVYGAGDDEFIKKTALEIRERAHNTGVIVVCCFDRLPTDEDLVRLRSTATVSCCSLSWRICVFVRTRSIVPS